MRETVWRAGVHVLGGKVGMIGCWNIGARRHELMRMMFAQSGNEWPNIRSRNEKYSLQGREHQPSLNRGWMELLGNVNQR